MTVGQPAVCQTFTVGVNPANLAITPDGKYGYVANSNNYRIPGSDTITVLDLQRGLPKTTISDPSFDEPYRMAIDCRGKRAYVVNSGSPSTAGEQGTVSIIDIRTNSVIDIIRGFDGPGAIVISGSTAWISNYGAAGGVGSGNGKTVSVVNLKLRRIVATIAVDLAPAALALSPCGGWLYVACYVDGQPGTGKLDIVSTRSNRVVATVSGFFGPFGIGVTPDGTRALITNFGSNDFAPYGRTVSVVDLRQRRIIKNIKLGIQPAGIAISPDGKYAFASNYNTLYAKPNFQNLTPGEGTVNIIRLVDNRVIPPTIPVGQSPSTLTLSPDGRTLYVCKYIQNTVAAICLDSTPP